MGKHSSISSGQEKALNANCHYCLLEKLLLSLLVFQTKNNGTMHSYNKSDVT
jgi:hypothetical protein